MLSDIQNQFFFLRSGNAFFVSRQDCLVEEAGIYHKATVLASLFSAISCRYFSVGEICEVTAINRKLFTLY